MTTRVLRVRADISGALTALDRLQNKGRRVARSLNQASGGTAGAVLGGGRRVGALGGGAGRAVLAGAGIGAGAAIVERLFESLFELFEDTEVLESLQGVLKQLLSAAAPLAGVLIGALVQPLQALLPAVTPVVKALAPLIELLGGLLTAAIVPLTPAIVALATGLEKGLTIVRDGIFEILPPIINFVEGAVRRVVGFINRLPGVDIKLPDAPLFELPELTRDQLPDVTRQVQEAQARRDAEAEGSGGSAGTRGTTAHGSPHRLLAESIAQSQARAAAGIARSNNLAATIVVNLDGAPIETVVRRVATAERDYGSSGG